MLKQDLLSLIEQKRIELYQVAAVNGLSSSVAIQYSQELDHLLNQYNDTYVQKLQTQS
ncbi:Spo0A-P phosphatase [Bacillus sp. FJAT-27225]|uniref:aspartyl-phosphate phosphatase Spo0E family protein n=1 Tax=Bacillus sp. FJAT-27225 TaxID=1743144 RepID=UPI00080C2304|nr:aspartyl-phosphate phosphatase Spo0E family protein [Bacillus sp. FJAT-27225]OCA89302.1 Spo0A-P phosphatase [Bacillus sp. FJAT-27225]